ncbi:MAG: hypothetical protein WCB74_23130, partial [Pseudolabrys sp.]
PITTIAPAFLTTHAQHIEVADEGAEYGGTVTGHGHNHRTASTIINAAPGNTGAAFLLPRRVSPLN